MGVACLVAVVISTRTTGEALANRLAQIPALTLLRRRNLLVKSLPLTVAVRDVNC